MPHIYITIPFLIVAVLLLLAWARLCAWIDQDLGNLPELSPVLWQSLLLGSLAAMLLFWIVLPSFWLALPVNVAMATALAWWYRQVRVAQLGSAGEMFAALLGGVKFTGQRAPAQKSAAQLALTYLTAAKKPALLPASDAPEWAGMVLVDRLLVQAVENQARRVELVPGPQVYDARFTIDGVVYPQSGLPRSTAEPLIQAAKALAGLSLEERRRPQKGIFRSMDLEKHSTVWTVYSSGTTAGEKLVLAANEAGNWRVPVEQLGFAADQLTALQEALKGTEGLVLVASPPHMGRTTTLYSLVAAHDAYTNSIQTLETNPRLEFESVTVTRFDPETSVGGHARQLQSMMRKDPQVLLVAECPEPASATAIARYSVAEHRVYLGVFASSTLSAVEWWRKTVADDALAADCLRAVIAQRLVRLLCPTCKIAYQADPAKIARLNLPVARSMQAFRANTQPARDAKGNLVRCPECHSFGYHGQTAIFEVMLISAELRAAIRAGKPSEEIRGIARKNGMMLMVEQGVRKFAAGLTSIEEVLRVCGGGKTAGGKTAPAAAPRTPAAAARPETENKPR